MERVKSKALTRSNAPANTQDSAEAKVRLREYRFVMAYLKDPNATKAAIAAGVPQAGAHVTAQRLLKSAKVQMLLAKHRDSLQRTTGVTVERLLGELGKVAFASMQDYMTVDEEGQPHLDLSTL